VEYDMSRGDASDVSHSKEEPSEATTELRETFQLIDKDGDGLISLDELSCVLRSTGQLYSEQQLLTMINEADRDGDGRIDFDEFVCLTDNQSQLICRTDQELLLAFQLFDQDGNGYISGEELRDVMASLGEKLTEEELEAMMSEADTDNNGLIDFNEFKTMFSESQQTIRRGSQQLVQENGVWSN